MNDDDLDAAWEAVHDATPPDWYVGRPSYHDERHEWTQYAFDQREHAKVGVRSREWTAVGATELDCLLEMARCLRQLGAGRVPRWLHGGSQCYSALLHALLASSPPATDDASGT
jgi:hypothetical protein